MTQGKDKTLIQAIAEFQKSAPIILKSATNPFFKSKYADLPAVWHTIKDLMSANGLAVVNLNVIIDGIEYLETRIYHTSGEYLSSVSRLAPVKIDPQSVGSAITYMRRYALMSLLGLVADDDDDANAANGKTTNANAKQAEKHDEKNTKQEVKITDEEKSYISDRIKCINDAMKNATSTKMLDTIWNANEKDLVRIKEVGKQAWDKLNDNYLIMREKIAATEDEIPKNFGNIMAG